MKTIWLSIVLISMTLVASACALQRAQNSAETTAVTSPPPTTANSEAALLLWEGPALFAEDQTECHRLRVTEDFQTFVGLCEGEQTEVEFVTSGEGGLAGMVARFAPFQLDTANERITFNGGGEIAGRAWERAITSWANFTYAELASGRIGAANRTVLAWSLGEQDGRCQMLLVLSHGYATAGRTPCEGGQMEVIASGWIDTAEWGQFDAWLYGRAPLYQDNNYLDGRGTTEMSAEEAAALAEWAGKVYAKLTQAGSVPAELIRLRFGEATIDSLLEIRWWDWDIEKIARNLTAICGGDIGLLELGQ